MARTVSRRYRLIAPVVGMTAALLLSGCAAGKISQTQNQVAAIDGANGTVERLGIRNAHFAQADGLEYAAGASMPLYFYITNASPSADTLTAISTPAAQGVQMSGEAKVLGQNNIEVGADTPVTATVVGLNEKLTYGQSIPVTFQFATAGAVTVNVPIAIPEQRTEERPTVNILPEHGVDIWFGEAEHGEEHAEEGTEGDHEAPATEPVAGETAPPTH